MNHRTRMIMQGIIWGIVFTAFVLLLLGINFSSQDKTEERFKIVDRYKNCDVVRYANPWGSSYHYFLHCNSL